MRTTLAILILGALLASGCKQRFWTIIPDDESATVAVSEPVPQPDPEPEPETEPEPDAEPPTPKQIIFILGINGMD